MAVNIHISLLLESSDEWKFLYDLRNRIGSDSIYVYPEEPWVEKHLDELVRQRCEKCPWNTILKRDTTECRKEYAKSLFCQKRDNFRFLRERLCVLLGKN